MLSLIDRMTLWIARDPRSKGAALMLEAIKELESKTENKANDFEVILNMDVSRDAQCFGSANDCMPHARYQPRSRPPLNPYPSDE